MKLLICTQKNDPNDPVLGFFVRWIEEFRKYAEVDVITLDHLGGGNQVQRAWRFLRLVTRLRCDAVFVHMNPEYLVVAGWWWRLRGIRTALWYAHKSVNWKLRVAVFFANVICTPSPESFRLRSKKVVVTGHGIDTDFFKPNPAIKRGEHLLSVGRLDPIKGHDRAILLAHRNNWELVIVGEGTERESLEALAAKLEVKVRFTGGLTQEQLRGEYWRAGHFVSFSETGSMDKVLLEASACGLPGGLLTRTEVVAFHNLKTLVPKMLKAIKNF